MLCEFDRLQLRVYILRIIGRCSQSVRSNSDPAPICPLSHPYPWQVLPFVQEFARKQRFEVTMIEMRYTPSLNPTPYP